MLLKHCYSHASSLLVASLSLQYKESISPLLRLGPPSQPVFCCRSFYSTARKSFLPVRPGRLWRERRGREFSNEGGEELVRKLEIGRVRDMEEEEEGGEGKEGR